MTKLAGRICSKSLWLRDFGLVRLANKLRPLEPNNGLQILGSYADVPRNRNILISRLAPAPW